MFTNRLVWRFFALLLMVGCSSYHRMGDLNLVSTRNIDSRIDYVLLARYQVAVVKSSDAALEEAIDKVVKATPGGEYAMNVKVSVKSNGKKVALIGAGCASLTVANDLAPLGYEVTVFEALQTTGGLMRTNIPQFRLPPKVLDEEIGYILDMNVDLKLNHPIDSLKSLLAENFDAVFVGTGAPRGKNRGVDRESEVQSGCRERQTQRGERRPHAKGWRPDEFKLGLRPN